MKNRDAEASEPKHEESRAEGESASELDNVEDAFAKADAALEAASKACRVNGPKAWCDAVDALRPVLQALKSSRAVPGLEESALDAEPNDSQNKPE